MRKIELPTFAGKDCEACRKTGKLPPQLLPCDNCGSNLLKQVECTAGCRGTGQIEGTKASKLLLSTLAPTMKESQEGKGVDWEKYVVYHPIAQGLKASEETNVLYLSNEQWQALADCIKKTQWRAYDEEVYEVLAAVMNAPDEEAEQAQELNRPQRREISQSDARKAKRAAPAGPDGVSARPSDGEAI